uniref:Uncharacterized protein n=1 Tax=Anopheles merus TaxID=30066 RepID=A0A182VCJ4_ANOME
MVSAVSQKKIPTWREVIGESVLIEYKLKFALNFSYDIFDVINEGQQFEYLGFALSPTIRMAIMRKDQLFRDVECVSKMVNRYNDIVLNLSTPEVSYPSCKMPFILQTLSNLIQLRTKRSNRAMIVSFRHFQPSIDTQSVGQKCLKIIILSPSSCGPGMLISSSIPIPFSGFIHPERCISIINGQENPLFHKLLTTLVHRPKPISKVPR